MNERPPIPADLRRRVLVEAGHRCAIHTCRHPDVDVHHIVPWERCRKHEYDNLIALCPNCHRRADSGEIDRLSLKLYKARVVAAFGLWDYSPSGTANEKPMNDPSSKSRWQTATIRELYEAPPYEIALEFPVFNVTDSDVADLNVMLRSDALQWLLDTRSLRLAPEQGEGSWTAGIPSQLTSSYEVSYYTDQIVSIRFSVFHYGAGAAHPNHWTKVKNAQLGPLVRLDFADLFSRDSGYLKTVSEYCISKLTREKGLSEASEWILRGAGPEPQNFSKFNIKQEGLFITFDEYQVDCYASGPSHLLVPGNLLKAYLNPHCSVSQLWTE
jgi:hypothetical protein